MARFDTDVAYNAHDYFRCLQANRFSPIAYSEANFDVTSACKTYVGIQPYEVDR